MIFQFLPDRFMSDCVSAAEPVLLPHEAELLKQETPQRPSRRFLPPGLLAAAGRRGGGNIMAEAETSSDLNLLSRLDL